MVNLVKMILVVLLILFLITRKVNLGLALLSGAALMGLLAPLPVKTIFIAMAGAAIKPQTVHLLAAIYLVLLLGVIMKKTRCFEKTVAAFGALFPDKRISLAAIPSLIGLLPVLGGAMLSAPMIAEIGKDLKMSPETKTFINYWFRHVWEYVWPLYPGVILTAALLDISVFQLAAHQLPLTAAAIIGGVVLGLRQIQKSSQQAETCAALDRTSSLILLLQGVSPILMVVAFIFVARLDVVPALALTLVLFSLVLRIPQTQLWEAAKTSFSLNTVFVVLGVMAFKDVFEVTGLAAAIPANLIQLGVPPGVLIFTLPFLVGFMTGVTQAFVAVTFPLFLVWFKPADIYFPAVLLAYAGGFAGVLFSPVHFCLVLTREYFQADLRRVYRLIAPPASVVVLLAFLAYAAF